MAHNPPAVPADTSPEVWRKEMEARRALSDEQRMANYMAFRERALAMQDQAIRDKFPGISDLDFKVERARLRHGDEIADITRRELTKRQS